MIVHANHPAVRAELCILPAAGEPGSLAQQFETICVFLGDELREVDRTTAWQRARNAAIPHAREAEAR